MRQAAMIESLVTMACPKEDFFESNRPLALVTGATSGIGEAFARRLATDGYDLMLHGRRKERLDALAEELHKEHDIATDVLIAELAEESGIQVVEERLKRAENIELLVNNAGSGFHGLFHEVSAEAHEEMIAVHVRACVRLARASLPAMIARGRGAIINVSSVAAFMPSPGSVNYCAVKAYLKAFSEGLHMELSGIGVRIQALCPGYTRTEFHSRRGIDTSRIPDGLWVSPESVVEESLRCLKQGRVVCIPGRKYRFFVWLAKWLPQPWFRKLRSARMKREKGRGKS